MLLYKYAAPERLDVLNTGLIRFTQAASFNDPFECAPDVASLIPSDHQEEFLKRIEPELPSLLQKAAEELVPRLPLPPEFLVQFQAEITQVTPVQLLAVARQLLPTVFRQAQPSELQQTAGERFGILSLSEIPTDLLMWAHYAHSHRGILFGLDSEHPFFDASDSTSLGILSQVVYSVERPSLVIFDPSVSYPDMVERFVRDLLFTKASCWEYEKEWRFILPLDNLDRYPHVISGRLHLFNLPYAAIKRVILGARASAATLVALQNILSERAELRHIELFRAVVGNTR